jgi:hypothetical protein
MSYRSMSSDLRGSTDITNRKGKAGRRYIRPQLVCLEFRLNVPEKCGQILFFRDPRSLRGLLVCRKIRGMSLYVRICTREFHRGPLFLSLLEGSKEL